MGNFQGQIFSISLKRSQKLFIFCFLNSNNLNLEFSLFRKLDLAGSKNKKSLAHNFRKSFNRTWDDLWFGELIKREEIQNSFYKKFFWLINTWRNRLSMKESSPSNFFKRILELVFTFIIFFNQIISKENVSKS